MPSIFPTHFRDMNYQMVPYDGSPVLWRVSIYGICISDDILLLIKHQHERFYDIPGGGVEMNENLEQALVREGIEEAGWAIKPIKPILIETDYFYHSGEKHFYKSLQLYWLAEGTPTGSPPTEPLIKEVVQVPLSELDKYDVYPNLKKALNLYLESR